MKDRKTKLVKIVEATKELLSTLKREHHEICFGECNKIVYDGIPQLYDTDTPINGGDITWNGCSDFINLTEDQDDKIYELVFEKFFHYRFESFQRKYESLIDEYSEITDCYELYNDVVEPLLSNEEVDIDSLIGEYELYDTPTEYSLNGNEWVTNVLDLNPKEKQKVFVKTGPTINKKTISRIVVEYNK